MPTFCRHNRFFAECPICSKGTVLDTSTPAKRSRPAGGGGGTARKSSARASGPPPAYRGPYGSAGPYEDDEGRYEIRLERVPGGLRLADWGGGAIRRRAPVLDASDLAPLVVEAAEKDAIPARDADKLREALTAQPADGTNGATAAASKGRAGDLRDELRLERLDDGRLRVARWVNRPGSGWELQEAPVMLPAARFAEVLGKAARSGLLLA